MPPLVPSHSRSILAQSQSTTHWTSGAEWGLQTAEEKGKEKTPEGEGSKDELQSSQEDRSTEAKGEVRVTQEEGTTDEQETAEGKETDEAKKAEMGGEGEQAAEKEAREDLNLAMRQGFVTDEEFEDLMRDYSPKELETTRIADEVGLTNWEEVPEENQPEEIILDATRPGDGMEVEKEQHKVPTEGAAQPRKGEDSKGERLESQPGTKKSVQRRLVLQDDRSSLQQGKRCLHQGERA